MRMFAGPNGSGKSTLKEVIPDAWLGIYINPDEMEKAIRQHGYLDFEAFHLSPVIADLQMFLANSELLANQGKQAEVTRLRLDGQRLHFDDLAVDSYHTSVLADFIRRQLLHQGTSFTFETVMSSPDKVALLSTAKGLGFRCYLYYIATEDPKINEDRVRCRVENGGHDVSPDKIRSRYQRSLALLRDAVFLTDRAYLFDNSGSDREWLAEVTNGDEIVMKTDIMPHWFKAALWDRFDAP